MKIINFSVSNYCGIHGALEDNKINFEGSNTIFLLGQNNAGKSSFLHAYEAFYDDATKRLDEFFKREGAPIEMEIEVELEDGEKQSIPSEKLPNAEQKYFYGPNNNRLTFKKIWSTPDKKSNNLTLKKDKSGFEDKGYAGVGEHNVFKPLLPKPIFIPAMPSESDVDSLINEILSAKVKSLLKEKELEDYVQAQLTIRKLQQKAYQTDEVKEYKRTVNECFSKMFSDLRLNISEQDPDNVIKGIDKKFKVDFEHIDEQQQKLVNLPTDYSRIGHGAIRTALFSLLLMRDIASGKETSGKKEYLVLFEEPELFLHPRLAKTLRELIYEVSDSNTPFQIICASHSPQMIDITKPKTSLVRMYKLPDLSTKMHQIDESDLSDNPHLSNAQVKQEILEGLRFNPFICEAFYCDEVVLVEGDTEALIFRAYLNEISSKKDIFVVNCGTVTNFPFFQKLFSKFRIKYHLIFDTDQSTPTAKGNYFIFPDRIQKSIADQYEIDKEIPDYQVGEMCIHQTTFEPAHENIAREQLKFTYQSQVGTYGKPYAANLYWQEKLLPAIQTNDPDLGSVPIISHIKKILAE